MKIHHSNEERSPERGYRRKAVNLKGSFAMDKRFAQINNELSEMQDGKLSKYGMKPVDYQMILVIAKNLVVDGKALTFHKNMAEYFDRHGFKTAVYVDGINWLITA